MTSGIANADAVLQRHCGLCRFSAPIAQWNGHDCRPPYLKRAQEESWAAQRRAEEERNKPISCLECGRMSRPGQSHLCAPAPSAVDVATAQAAAGMEAAHIADVLRKAGYQVTKKADT